MSDVFGVSGMLMLQALADGNFVPAEMLLGMHLRRLAGIDRDLAEIGAAIADAMRPFAAQQILLATIPGVDELIAATIVAEVGVDMTTFGTAQQLAAWAGVCPASHESAGKQRQRGTRKGNTFLEAALVTAVMSASQVKGGYLRDKFYRLKQRMSTKKAVMAVAHKILIAAFHMLQRGAAFADLGGDYLDQANKHRSAKHLVRRLGALGYDVMLRAKATA